MVEGAALEMLFRGNSNEGSNPSLSVLDLPIQTTVDRFGSAVVCDRRAE